LRRGRGEWCERDEVPLKLPIGIFRSSTSLGLSSLWFNNTGVFKRGVSPSSILNPLSLIRRGGHRG